MTEEEVQYQRALQGDWKQEWLDGNADRLRVVALHDGWGIFNFYKNKWILEPRYQRIVVPTGGSKVETAVIQLGKNGKWRIKDISGKNLWWEYQREFNENPLEVEFDEIKFVDGLPFVAINKKDRNGRNHWRIWRDGRWQDAEDWSYRDLNIYANKYSGKYDLVTQEQDGSWNLAIEGTGSLEGLSSVGRVGERGLYLIGTKIGDKVRYNLVHNDNISGMLPEYYDRIMPENGFLTLTQGHKMGIATTVKENDDKPARAEVLIPAIYDYAKMERVTIDDKTYAYGLVGDNDGYGFYSIAYNMQMLPNMFTAEEVRDFESRLLTATLSPYSYIREGFNETFSTEGKGDFREYCMGRAKECYQGMKTYSMTDAEARDILDEDNLRMEYFERQNSLYNKQSKLGKYDKERQAFVIETHWGTTYLPVPPEEASAVKQAWKRRNKENIVEYGLDLDSNFRPTLADITIKVNGREYRSK